MNVLAIAFLGLVPLTTPASPAPAPAAIVQSAPGIRASLAKMDFAAAPVAMQAKPKRSTQRKVLGGVLGAVGGFFAGAFIGPVIQGDCSCDDPGLEGMMYGAPIGAIIGGILGAKFF